MNHGSNHTGRMARSLNEAFGPYNSGPIHEPASADYGAAWWAAMLVVAVIGFIVVVVTR